MGVELKSQIKRRKTREEYEQYDGMTEFMAFEILTRLPVKSLVKCKSVCRSWRSLISDPVFIAAHLKRSGENPQLIIVAFSPKLPRRGFDMYTYEERKKRARFLFGEDFVSFQEHTFLPQHCNGLVLLNTMKQLVVCNPSTKELVALPSDKRGEDGPLIVDHFTFSPSMFDYLKPPSTTISCAGDLVRIGMAGYIIMLLLLPCIRKKRGIIHNEMKSQIKRWKHEPEQCDVLTEFIAFEILTRLPVKSMLRCKSVCKSWHALLSSPTFIAAQASETVEGKSTVRSRSYFSHIHTSRNRYVYL
ncbi:uncharacterized protein A4U43_C06F1870 [Asparagus officinalis]|uniref:F-box domain-containing protein n=1 Tax=Asparagus officinalis TaxID=4686 RepID=A0A5P1EIT7_ASPOF|nr:uncharacterized protein A4U43_C06F1870 [Asparagus officinalis]